MRIAIIVYNFPPIWLAGTEIATYQMAEHLVKNGHEVHIITTLDDGLPQLSYEKGIHIHRLPIINIRIIDRITFWTNTIKTVLEIKPDVIHAQSLVCGLPALISSKLLNVPYVVYGRGSDVYLPDISIKITIRAVLKNAGAVIALTEHMRSTIMKKHNEDIVVVPNGIKPINYTEKNKNLEEPSNNIIFIGRLHPIKGIHYLLTAMAIVHQELPDAILILVGDGEDRRHLENLTHSLGIRDNVKFVGKVSHENIPEYMQNADIFVLPSLSEGFPVTVLEAMSCGLPIVASRVGGLPDIIEEGVNGYLVEATRPDEIADSILLLMRNDTIRSEISTHNIEKAKMFTWDKVTGTLEEVYQNAIAEHEKGK